MGNELPTVPKVTYSLSAQFEDQVSFGGFGDWDWFARGDLAHQGSRFTSYANTAETSAYNNLNLRLGVRNGNLSIEAYMLNALDHDEFIGAVRGSIDPWTFTGFGGPNQNEIRISAPLPRRWGVRASYEF